MIKPFVSIIVLNWNGDRHVHRCVEHATAQSYEGIEVIVIDNGSTDGSAEKLKNRYPDLTYIMNEENRGYAAGMNQGIGIAKGDHVIPLNQDVCLHKDFVLECVNRIQKDNGIGAIGGRVFSWIGDDLTDVLRKGEGERYFLRKRFQGIGGLKSEGEAYVFAPAGSFPFLSKTMLEDIRKTSGEYYDENFVTGWEDIDLFFRMHLRGWRCLFLPAAYGWHVGSGSVGGKSTFLSKNLDFQIRVLRNRYFTIIKDIPADTLVWLLPYLLLTEIAIIPYFIIRSPKSIIALFVAWAQTVSRLPVLVKKRRAIQKNVNVETGYLKKFFVEI